MCCAEKQGACSLLMALGGAERETCRRTFRRAVVLLCLLRGWAAQPCCMSSMSCAEPTLPLYCLFAFPQDEQDHVAELEAAAADLEAQLVSATEAAEKQKASDW